MSQFEFHRIEDTAAPLSGEPGAVDIALLDMNHGWHNLGHDAIVRNIEEMVLRLDPHLTEAGLRVRLFSFDVRKALAVPEPGRFQIFVGTGGPGNLDPRLNDGSSDGAQGVDEDPSWESRLWRLFDSIAEDDTTSLFAVCHTFGVLCRWAGVARAQMRSAAKGKSSGAVQNILSAEARRHPFFARLAEILPDGEHLRVTDNRLFDLIPEPGAFSRNGNIPIGYEGDQKDGTSGQALTMIELSRDRGGIMPRILGVNHHPEIMDRHYIREVLEGKWARGEVSEEWYQERVQTLESHMKGEYDFFLRITSTFTLLLPLEFQLQRMVRERREQSGFSAGIDENELIPKPDPKPPRSAGVS